MPIHVLTDKVVAQIAAGEVIERPASVVKELLENALDAGATSIHISITNGGRRKIQISDNGSGIATDEIEKAFARHATSKLTDVHDLEDIRTLGFRGEALASIASVSRVSVRTRTHDAQMGIEMHLEGGQILHKQAIGTPAGTTLIIENLFFNTPARLKFLKAESTEKRQISLVVSRYAMAYPQVRFILEQDGRESFRTGGTGQLSDVLVAALGVEAFRDMIEIETIENPYPSVEINGYVSHPSLNRADRSHITLFVNGRWVQDSSIAYAVTQAYHTFLMKGRFPVAVVMIDLPPAEVDVNVHPSKAEVRFQNPNEVFAAVQRIIRRTLINHIQTPSIGNTGMPLRNITPQQNPQQQAPVQLDMGLEIESPGHYPHQHQDLPRPQEQSFSATEIPYGPEPPTRPRTLPMLRVVGQIAASYIVAEGPAGVYLIDQHAAHERILYEQFMVNLQQQQPLAQLTLSVQTIDLSPTETYLIQENTEALNAVGFELEHFGGNTFLVRSIPAMLADEEPTEAVYSVLEELEQGLNPGQITLEEKLIQRVCKQAAVKAGTILSLDEMQAIIRQLERTQSPHTCPHGRPTMLHMSSDQLAREFGRK